MMNCFSEIIRNDGLNGLYKGIAPSLLKAYLSTAITLSIYDSVCNHFRQISSD
jgi:solute carrier family 25 thiamine pyrophosphate transporter 19